MSDIIQLLPDAIANQIAAGEVIQRPSSVVKELLENAIDADAESIHLIIKDAGKTLIQVNDDGKGMSETDVRTSIERHATSKLKTAQDLQRIKTMGFRGEALSSIAAIAHMEIKTRQADSEIGTCLKVKGSVVESQDFCQAPRGTSMIVRNLFFNVPARRRFLKSNTVELKHIIQEFQHVALAWPEINFTMHHNDEEVYKLSAGNHKQRVTEVLGKKYKDGLVPIEEQTELISLKGFVGKPELAKKTRGDQYFFVNKRFIKDYYLHYAIKSAFEDLIPADYNPSYAIYINVDPKFIDVNVHPTKQEIKFEDQRIVYSYLKTTIRHALGRYHISPSLDFDVQGGMDAGLLIHQGKTNPSQSRGTGQFPLKSSDGGKQDWESYYENIKNTEVTPGEDKIVTMQSTIDEENNLDLSSKNFQLKDSYIVTQIKSGLILIDQHHAHTRILYEKFLSSLQEQSLHKEQMMFPQTLELDPGQSAILNAMIDSLNQMGFEISEFGKNTFIIHATPPSLGKYKAIDDILIGILDEAGDEKELKSGVEEHIAFLLAKNSAITKGRSLDQAEMNSIIAQLFACEMPYKTPKGKKCFVVISTDEITTLFKQKL